MGAWAVVLAVGLAAELAVAEDSGVELAPAGGWTVGWTVGRTVGWVVGLAGASGAMEAVEMSVISVSAATA